MCKNILDGETVQSTDTSEAVDSEARQPSNENEADEISEETDFTSFADHCENLAVIPISSPDHQAEHDEDHVETNFVAFRGLAKIFWRHLM